MTTKDVLPRGGVKVRLSTSYTAVKIYQYYNKVNKAARQTANVKVLATVLRSLGTAAFLTDMVFRKLTKCIKTFSRTITCYRE